MDQATHQPSPADLANGQPLARRVLLIGSQGADRRVISSLLNSNRLVHLAALLERGVQIDLTLPRPTHGQAAWTSLATGTYAHQHGVLHSHVPAADGRGLAPITGRSRRRPAVWNLLNAANLQTHVVGWPVTSPAEDIAGVSVSDHLGAALAGPARANLAEAWVAPQALQSVLRGRFVAPSQLDEITVAQMLPRSAQSLPMLPQLTAACRSILAEAATHFRVLRWCLSERPWTFAACVFPGLRRAHELAAWLVAAQPDATECAREIVAGCYEHHDLLLGQLLAQADDTHVLVVALGAGDTSGEPACGLAAFAGPAVSHVPGPTRRSALDVAPTLLAMLGAAIPNDLPGQPWCDLFEQDLSPIRIRSNNLPAERLEAEADNSTTAAGADLASFEPDPAVEHLLQLGYTDPLEVRERESLRLCLWTTQLQRAVSQFDAGLRDEAIASLEACVDQRPDSHFARALLAEAYFQSGRRPAARQQINWLRFHGNEQPQVYRLAAAIDEAERNFAAALDELTGTRRGAIRFPGAAELEGNLSLRLQEFERARAAFQSALQSGGPAPQTLSGLAATELQAGRPAEAAVFALDALAADMRFGRAHYCLAVALFQLARTDEAIQAFETWARVEPTAAAPFRWLAHVCEVQRLDPLRAASYRDQGRAVVRERRKTRSATANDTSALSSPR